MHERNKNKKKNESDDVESQGDIKTEDTESYEK